MKYYTVKDSSGNHEATETAQQQSTAGYEIDALADTEVLTTEITSGIVSVVTADDEAKFVVQKIGGTLSTELLGTNASFSTTKDTASVINVYIENDVVNVQNNSGAAITGSVNSYA